MTLDYTPVRESGIRVTLMWGCDRSLVMLSAIGCASVSVLFTKLSVFLVLFVLWVAILIGLRMIAKIDPRMSQKYTEYVQNYFRDFPAASHPSYTPKIKFK